MRLAHANRCAGEWQQQLVQHCCAVRQPHKLCWHGKGALSSFAGVALRPGPLLQRVERPAVGKGTIDAQKTISTARVNPLDAFN